MSDSADHECTNVGDHANVEGVVPEDDNARGANDPAFKAELTCNPTAEEDASCQY